LPKTEHCECNEDETFQEDGGEGSLVGDVAGAVVADDVEGEVGVETWMVLVLT
jgi:hypothetical protein